MRLWKIWLAALSLLMVVMSTAGRSSAAPLQPGVVEEAALTGSDNNKLPSLATGNGRVYISWGAPNNAQFAEREEEAGQFSYATLGSIGSSSSYFNTAVATGSDGTLHYAWIQNGDTIRYRNRAVGQNLSGDRVAWNGGGFANSLAIAVQGTSNIFLAWRLADGTLVFAYSNNSGANWATGNVEMRSAAYRGKPYLATGPNGEIYMIWKGVDRNIYLGRWNGSNFPNSSITNSDNDFFDPTVAVGPTGQVFAAWRSISRGVYFYIASSGPNGSRGEFNVFQHDTVGGPVKIVVDSLSNIHLAWLSKEGGNWQTWYSVKSPTESFSQPVVVSRDNGFKANVDMAVSVKQGYTLAHLAWEAFSGDTSAIRYGRVRTLTSGGATPNPTQPTPTPTPTTAPTPTPTPAPNAPVTGSFGFATTAFQDLWTRTDSLVRQNAVTYSWIWGPSAFTAGVSEYYVQSPGQARTVQYFDKSRMEINQPSAPRGPYYVTNGRLADELITGSLQTGDAQYERRAPAAIPVAGDPQNTFPLYRDLQSVYRKTRASDRADQMLYRAANGQIETQPAAGASTDPQMVITQRVAGLGIPKIFWDFMNRPGRVVENGQAVNASPLYDWRYVIGEPLTEAYWTYVKVNGRDAGVLVQAFERRVLTYTPVNPAGFEVEMGNIGRHYFEWRYGVRPR